MHCDTIKQLIETHLPKSQAIVTSDDNVHFTATVTAPQFANHSRVQQQQMVMAILQEYIQRGEIHALALKTQLPTATDGH